MWRLRICDLISRGNYTKDFPPWVHYLQPEYAFRELVKRSKYPLGGH